jgi:hypothetical protein
MNRLIATVAGSTVLLATACGVTTEDEPQLIDNTTSQSPAATPSVDSETGPIPPPSTTSSSTSFVTPTPTPSAPEQPAGLQDPAGYHRSA